MVAKIKFTDRNGADIHRLHGVNANFLINKMSEISSECSFTSNIGILRQEKDIISISPRGLN